MTAPCFFNDRPIALQTTIPHGDPVIAIFSKSRQQFEFALQVKLLLAPEIDMSSVKITVKNKNLRVKLRRPLGELARRLPLSIHEKSPLNELVKKAVTYYENFLIPESIDGDKVRAIVDNKNRILLLTAPTIKPCKALRRRFSMMLDD